MDNKFIGLMVGLTVGVLMLSGFLWPVVADATTTTETFENKGYAYMTNDDSISRHYVYDGTTLTVNDVELSYGTSNHTLIVADNMLLMREAWNGLTVFKASIGNAYWGVVTDSFDFTIYNGTVTGTLVNSGNSGTINVSYDEIWMAIPEKSDYILTEYNSSNYVLNESQIYGFGITGVKNSDSDTTSTKLIVKGSIADGFTAEIESRVSNVGTITLGDVTANYTAVSGVKNTYLLDSLTFVATYTENDTTYTTDVIYSSFIIPAKVTAEKSWHLDTTQIALVAAIGTLGAIVLIAAAAGSIRRLD